ncbi:Hypothetical protein D9617_3g022830 [Elsinoe fawcettii]|nr:Hypothetical protein D9617_3g022830 [Elsinoe fawcettii]
MTKVTITTGGEERMHSAAALYAKVFRDDPVLNYMMCDLTAEQHRNYFYTYFTCLMKASALNGGLFQETGDWKSASIIIPPGRRVDNPWTLISAGMLGMLYQLGFGGLKRMLWEYEPKTAAARAKALGSVKSYYYVFFVATRDDSRGNGLSSALLQEAQRMATLEGLPVWLEATTEYSSRIYSKLEFKIVETIMLGVGRAAADGKKESGGAGVPVHGMIWWPESAKVG